MAGADFVPAAAAQILVDEVATIGLALPAEEVLERHAPQGHVPAAAERGADLVAFEIEGLHCRAEVLADHLFEPEFPLVARRRRRVLNWLALALQIGFLKMTGGTLNSVEIIPAGVLEHLGRQLGCAPPRIASIRALYRRRRTLFDHQAAALLALGRTEPSEHAERGLVAYLRREAAAAFDNAELMARSRSWLVNHDYLLLRDREIRRLIGAARRHQEQTLFKIIVAVAGSDRETWLPRLFTPIASKTGAIRTGSCTSLPR